MAFCSVGFILFLIGTVFLYYTVPKRHQPRLLLAASCIFYLFSGIENFAFIFFSSVVTFFCALIIGKDIEREKICESEKGADRTKEERRRAREKNKKRRLRVLLIGLAFIFAPLLALKLYTSAFYQSYSVVLQTYRRSLVLPLGISFYTLQCAGYLIDVYRGKCRVEASFFRLTLFITFFPQLILGPISRYSALAPQLFEHRAAKWDNIVGGTNRIAWGYFKKLVIADTVISLVKNITSEPRDYGGAYVFLLIIVYSLEIYADFTGGIDIALGVAETLGIKMAENFDRPFSSTSVREYWNRWHITLGAWFTDYVFYPLSICRPMQRLSKKVRAKLGNATGKRIPMYIATLSTWFLTGLWHGASASFILWGLSNSLVILASQELAPIYCKFHAALPRLKDSTVWQSFCKVRTFFIVGTIRLFDVYGSVSDTVLAWGSLFTSFISWRELFTDGFLSLGLDKHGIFVLFFGIGLMILASRISARNGDGMRKYIVDKPLLATLCPAILIIATLVFGSYGIGFEQSSFIYTQF